MNYHDDTDQTAAHATTPAQNTDPEVERLNPLTHRIIGAAMEVHRIIGPGLAERIYADALAIELAQVGIEYQREVNLPVVYKGHRLGHYQLDFLIDRSVAVEAKSVDRMGPVFDAQLRNYMVLTHVRVGLLLNFNSALLKDGVRRIVL